MKNNIQISINIFVLTFSLLLFHSEMLYSQTEPNNNLKEITDLVDLPTAGIIPTGSFSTNIETLPNGILTAKMDISFLKNLSLGISYGGVNIIGKGDPDWYSKLGYNAKFRVFTETRRLPSFSIGFNSQGKGIYIDSLSRYEIKSHGIYISLTKNYKFLGYLSVHGLVNYTLENKDDRGLNFGFGVEKTITSYISLLAEYNFNLDDNSKNSIGNEFGVLNTGIRWFIGNNVMIGLDLRNLLKGKRNIYENGIERSLTIKYNTNLF